LSIQLPITIFVQIYLTSSKKIMGKYANKKLFKIALWCTGIFVTVLNVLLFISLFKSI
ncbi:MAG TPA: Mg2+/Co2+ transporter, partial [Clostridiaceae bacterium]|nr:Mg2+/Co2+ transporter [Clostridiaceae bacterium]